MLSSLNDSTSVIKVLVEKTDKSSVWFGPELNSGFDPQNEDKSSELDGLSCLCRRLMESIVRYELSAREEARNELSARKELSKSADDIESDKPVFLNRLPVESVVWMDPNEDRES